MRLHRRSTICAGRDGRIDASGERIRRSKASVGGGIQIETGLTLGLSAPFQSVACDRSLNVGTLLRGALK